MINRKTKIALEGIIGDQDSLSYLLTRYKPIVDKLRAEHAELDLKKHCDYPVFGIRADECHRGNRLLFIMLRKNNASYLYFLGDIENHDYRKSPFFQPGRLSRFLERNNLENSQELNIDYALLSEDNFSQEEYELEKPDKKSAIKPMAFYNQNFVELTPYHDHFISLTDEQKAAIKIGIPSMVTGGPGAGKSFIALEFLTELTSKAENNVVCITHSLPLMLFIRKQFTQQLGGVETKGNVRFVTYSELAKEFALETKAILVGEKEFMDWLKRYINGKNNQLTHKFTFDLKTVYQEFRIISGYYDEKNNHKPDNTTYLSLGERASLFFESEKKQWLWEAYDAYQKHLKEHNQINPEFCTLDFSHRYSHAILDEVQDYTPAEFRSIFKLTNGQIICLGDSHQNLIDPKSSLNLKFIRSYFNEMGIKIPHHKLKITHRVPQKIAALVNQLCQLNYALEEGDPNNDEGSFIKSSRLEDDGEIEFITLSDHDLAQKAKGETAVITREENIKKAKERYQSDLIFDINNIKGLEFPNIIIDIFDDPQYSEIDKIVPTLDLDKYVYQENKKISRPKSVAKHEKYGTKLKRLFVAASRATNKLILVMDKKKLPHLFKFLNQKSSPHVVEKKVSVYHSPTPINWRKVSEKLLINGHESQAQAIFLDKDKLNTTLEEFNAFKDHVLGLSLQNLLKENIPSKKPVSPVEQETKKDNKENAKKNNKEKIKERSNYLNNLLSSFNEKNLKSLFEDKRFEELMFKFAFQKNTGVKKHEEKEILFISIIKDEKLNNIFCEFLSNNLDHIKKFTSQIMLASFKWTHDLQNYESPYPSTLFFIAAGTKKGLTLLKILLKNNKELTSKITWNFLFRLFSNKRSFYPWEKFSTLQALFLNGENVEFLNLLFTLNPNLKSEMSSKNLFLDFCCGKESDNISLFYSLTITEESCKILDDLLMSNSNLKVPKAMLYRSLTEKAGNSQYSTPFLGLSKRVTGRKILSRLIEDREILEGITEEALFLGYLNIMDSAFYWLTTDDLGLDILTSLLNANPNLITSPYLANALYQKINLEGNSLHHNASALSNLAKTAKGRKILNLLFKEKKNEVLRKKMTEMHLFTQDEKINDTLFYWLTVDFYGLDSLYSILTSNPIVTSSPKLADVLDCIINNEKDPINDNQTPLGCLTKSTLGLNILLYLAKHNSAVQKKLANPEVGKYIGDKLTFRKDPTFYSTLLALMGRMSVGMPLLQNLLEVIPHLKINGNVLCDPYSDEIHDDCSILTAFSIHNESAHSLFLLLLNKNPEMALGITMEGLCRTYSLKSEKDKREFSKLKPEERRTFSRFCRLPLLKLTSTPEGLQVLTFLFKKNIALLNEMIKILSSMVNDPLKASLKILKNPDICDDIKKILSSSNEQQINLVVMLFEKYPQITFNIAAEYWHHNVDDYNFESYDFKEAKSSEEKKEEKITPSQNPATLFYNDLLSDKEEEIKAKQNLSQIDSPKERADKSPF